MLPSLPASTHIPEDLDALARTIFGEARRESFNGQVAVGWVVLNRVARPGWWGHSIRGVCQAPRQFSCWNYDDPNREKLLAATLDDPAYVRAFGAAALVITKTLPDPTQGATHYYATYIPRPSWAESMKATVSIGLHSFFREDA